MWLVNMNCLGVLGKKLAGVKCEKMVKKWWKKSIFLGRLKSGWGGLCEIFLTIYLVNMNCLGGLPMGRGWLGRVV